MSQSNALQDELAQLKAELAALREQQVATDLQHQQRLDNFSNKLDKLVELADGNKAEENLSNTKTPQTICDLGLQATHTTLSNKSAPPKIPELTADTNQQAITDKTQQKATASHVSSTFSSGLLEQFSEMVFAPFTPLWGKACAFYRHYQERGLAAVFLMTIAGVITLTLGFSYLLQYSFNHWLSEIGKVTFAFICANTLLALGVFLYKRRAQMQDYASALIALGLIINYVSTYFSGPYFHLIPDWLSLFLLLVISLLGFFLSFKFSTKVVAVLTLAGGSLAPMMLFDSSGEQLIYLPYLLLMGICAIIQSRLLRWPLLIELTAFLHIACVEFFIVFQSVHFEQLSPIAALGLLSINLMFYLYGFSGLYWLAQSNNQLILNKRLLVVPIALFAFILFSINQLSMDAGYLFLFNALLFAAIYLKANIQSTLKVFALFLAASFAGFAALQLMSQELLSLVLLAEGIALLYVGCKGNYYAIRIESYTLILIGLISHAIALSSALDFSSTLSAEQMIAVLYLALSAAALFILARLMKPILVNCLSTFECKLYTVFRECLSVNYSLLIIYIAMLISIDYAVNVLPLVSLLLLYLAKKEQLKISEILAWLLLLPLLGVVILEMLLTGNLQFSQQPLYAQIARVELLLCCIGLYYGYKRFNTDSKLIKLAHFLQIACFVILPLMFLPKVVREVPEYISLALCLSALISLYVAYISRHRLLFMEAKVILLTTVLAIAISCLDGLWQGLVALTTAAVLFTYLYQIYATLPRLIKLLMRAHWLCSPYYFALVAVVIVHSIMTGVGVANWGIAVASLVAYFTWLLRLKPLPLVLHQSIFSSLLCIGLATLLTPLLHIDNGLNLTVDSLLYMFAESLILACLYQLIFNNQLAIRMLSKKFAPIHCHWAWHILLTISYVLWSYQLSAIIAAPLSAILLVVHGSGLMFISLREGQAATIKLASVLFAVACAKVILVDMANFLIVQKVIAFMLIGGILLAVSYFYQKIKNQQKHMTSEMEITNIKDAGN